MRLRDPSFWPLADLAREWNCTEDRIRVFEDDGLLVLDTREIGGELRLGVTDDERKRFEGAEHEPRQHPAQRKGDRLLLAMMLAVWCGADEHYMEDDKDRHYRLRDLLASDVEAALGMKLSRTRESDALAIREGFELLRARGWRPRQSKGEPQLDQGETKAA